MTDYLSHKKDSLKIGHIWFDELSSRQRIEVIRKFMQWALDRAKIYT